MINSQLVAMEFVSLLPKKQRPETTEKYQGFFHVTDVCGSVERTEIQLIIRDHDQKKFEKKQAVLRDIAKKINVKYGEVVQLELQHQYFNMRQQILPHFQIVAIAKRAMEIAGIKPKIQPIRGGTDGANLSFMGLPCPNIFAGGHNFHGRFEYIPLESMEKAVEVMKNIITLFTNTTKKC